MVKLSKVEVLGVLPFLLVSLGVVYLLSNIPTPAFLANVVHTWFGQCVLAAILLAACWHGHPVVSTLLILMVFELIRRAWMNPEAQKAREMHTLNEPHAEQLQHTLEEEMVRTMAPAVYSGMPLDAATYAFSQTDVQDAAAVHAPYHL